MLDGAPELSQMVTDWSGFDNDQYELGCYAVIPNHVHGIFRPLQPKSLPLEKILQSRKRRTSREINVVVGGRGSLWQEESFDRIIRDEEHLYRCIQLIGRNPAKARLPSDQWRRWVRPSSGIVRLEVRRLKKAGRIGNPSYDLGA